MPLWPKVCGMKIRYDSLTWSLKRLWWSKKRVFQDYPRQCSISSFPGKIKFWSGKVRYMYLVALSLVKLKISYDVMICLVRKAVIDHGRVDFQGFSFYKKSQNAARKMLKKYHGYLSNVQKENQRICCKYSIHKNPIYKQIPSKGTVL